MVQNVRRTHWTDRWKKNPLMVIVSSPRSDLLRLSTKTDGLGWTAAWLWYYNRSLDSQVLIFYSLCDIVSLYIKSIQVVGWGMNECTNRTELWSLVDPSLYKPPSTQMYLFIIVNIFQLYQPWTVDHLQFHSAVVWSAPLLWYDTVMESEYSKHTWLLFGYTFKMTMIAF